MALRFCTNEGVGSIVSYLHKSQCSFQGGGVERERFACYQKCRENRYYGVGGREEMSPPHSAADRLFLASKRFISLPCCE